MVIGSVITGSKSTYVRVHFPRLVQIFERIYPRDTATNQSDSLEIVPTGEPKAVPITIKFHQKFKLGKLLGLSLISTWKQFSSGNEYRTIGHDHAALIHIQYPNPIP